MSQAAKKSRTKREIVAEEDSDDDLPPIQFFVPGDGIDTEVLVVYILKYVDDTAKIAPSPNPSDPRRMGFNITARKGLNAVGLRDLMDDSRDWDTEKSSRKWKEERYRYAHSKTADRRGRKGPTKGNTQKFRRAASIEPEESARRASIPVSSPPPGQYAQGYSGGMSRDPGLSYQQSVPRDSEYSSYQMAPTSRDQSSYRQHSSMQEPGSGSMPSYHVNVSNWPGSHGQPQYAGQSQYPGVGFSNVTKSEYASPPPAYTNRNPGFPDPDPDNPDPDSFDVEHPVSVPYTKRDISKSARPPGSQQDRDYGYGR